MPIKSFRPITPSLRFATKLVSDDITTDKPHKPLLGVKPRTGGRNNTGSLSVRHHGGGHKQKLRMIDFKRDKYGIPGTVATVEYERVMQFGDIGGRSKTSSMVTGVVRRCSA